MLINKVTNNARGVIAVPTESYGGFEAGKQYYFEHQLNGLYKTVLDNGQEKYDDLDGQSAHLWDGEDWDSAGHFDIVKIIK